MAPEIARKMLVFEEAGEPQVPCLTGRDLQVVAALARGNEQIAPAFGIIGRTIRNHFSNIYKGLHVYDRTRAVTVHGIPGGRSRTS